MRMRVCSMQIMLNLRLLHAFSHNSAFKDPTRNEGKNSLTFSLQCVSERKSERQRERETDGERKIKKVEARYAYVSFERQIYVQNSY